MKSTASYRSLSSPQIKSFANRYILLLNRPTSTDKERRLMYSKILASRIFTTAQFCAPSILNEIYRDNQASARKKKTNPLECKCK